MTVSVCASVCRGSRKDLAGLGLVLGLVLGLGIVCFTGCSISVGRVAGWDIFLYIQCYIYIVCPGIYIHIYIYSVSQWTGRWWVRLYVCVTSYASVKPLSQGP